MMNLDLNIEVVDLDGNSVGKTAGQMLAQVIMQSETSDPVKFHNWALMMHRNEPIPLDASDLTKLKDFVKGAKMFTFLAAPITSALDALK